MRSGVQAEILDGSEERLCWLKRLLFQGWGDVRLAGPEGKIGLSGQHRRDSSHFHELPARENPHSIAA
jgi:hypothetical protein